MGRLRLPWAAAILALAACDTNTAPPPFDAVDTRSDGAVASTETIVVTSAAEIAGVERVRGHLVVDIAGPVRLPDLQGVDGDLRIVGSEAKRGASDILLPKLVRVGGDVDIAWTDGEARITASNLEEIGGHLDLSHGSWRVDLPSLAKVGGDVRVSDGTLEGADLGALAGVGGSLRLIGVTLATDATLDLGALEDVHLDVVVKGGAVRLEASRCVAIGGDLVVEDAHATVAFSGLRETGGDVRFEGAELDRLDLGALRSVGDDLVLDDARGAALATFELGALSGISGDLRVRRVDGLGSIVMTQLAEIGGSALIDPGPSLTQVIMPQLEGLGGDLVIADGGDLTVAMDALDRVPGDFVVGGNEACDGGFSGLAEIGGGMLLADQRMTYTGLGALEKVGQSLAIDGVVGGSDFDELRFDALRTVGGAFEVRDTRSLEKTVANELISIGSGSAASGDLVVRGNLDLTSVLFSKLGAVSGAIIVRDNPRLAVDGVLAELADVQAGTAALVCNNLGGEPCP